MKPGATTAADVELVDTHCHLDVEAFDPDRAEVLARARSAGVRHVVVPAIDAGGWPGLRSACRGDPGLHACYGLHPLMVDRHRDADLEDLREWIERERPVAVGECGLDYFVEGLDRDRQHAVFRAQLALAREFDLPVVVHARRAVEDVIIALRETGGLRGVVHSFAGSEEQARQLWEIGFHVGLGGPVTYERAKRLRRIAARIPLEQLLLETDAPDQPDCESQGTRNEPARIGRVLEEVARLRDMTPEALARATTDNAKRLFGLD